MFDRVLNTPLGKLTVSDACYDNDNDNQFNHGGSPWFNFTALKIISGFTKRCNKPLKQ